MKAEKEKLSPTLAEIFAEAREEGKEEGIEKGKAEGKAEGIEEARSMFAQELIRNKYSDETIAKLTRLDVESVRNLKETMEC